MRSLLLVKTLNKDFKSIKEATEAESWVCFNENKDVFVLFNQKLIDINLDKRKMYQSAVLWTSAAAHLDIKR